MKKYLLSLGVIAAATLSLTSCLGSGKNETNYDFTYSDCFNYVVDRQENTVYVGHSPIYKFVFHNDLALDMDITNLKLNADQTLNLRFPTMSTQISSTDGFTIFTAYNVLPVGAGASYEFDTIKFRGYPWRSPAIYDLTYTVNDRYDVTVYPTVLGYYAQATVTNKTEGATDPVFTGKDLEVGTYMITINSEKMTASLFVMEGKFEKNSYDTERLEVRNLPVTIIDGGFRIVTEPGVTYPVYDYQQASSASALTDYSMSDISLTAYLSTGASLSYNCTLGKNNQGYPKNYNVSTTLRYFPFSAETQQ